MWSQCQTDKWEDILWKESRLLSGLENIRGVVTIKTEDIESEENLRGGMMYEVEKPSYEKAISFSVWFKSRKRIDVWKLQEAIYMKNKVNFTDGR